MISESEIVWQRKLQTHCRNGHAMTAANTRVERKRGGRFQRKCKVCEAEKFKRYENKRKNKPYRRLTP